MREFIPKDFKEAFINKSLEKYNVKFSDVRKNPLINGVQWNEHYTLTEDEYKDWYHWCIKLLSKKYPDKSDNSLKTMFFDEYVIPYGLTQI